MNPILAAFVLPIALELPRRLTRVASWHEHIPFGMNLVAALRPRTLVELGTHAGDSYCGFCQAVLASGLATGCFAVDTWRGDPQAGEYGPEVLADLRAHHDPLYGGFSRLVESTFDDAVQHFEDGSIDLLHVDGLHTYEAVRHDFETWRPKLSASAVVLFHDTNVHERDFGVARFWAEVRSAYLSFEFTHGHGLGVLAVGSDRPSALEPLLAAGDHDAREVRDLFFALGQRVASTAVIADLKATLKARGEELRRAVANAAAIQTALEQGRDELESTRGALAVQNATLDRIAGTAAWRAVNRYWSVRDRLLRPGSAPRRAFDAATRVLKRSHASTTAPGTQAVQPGIAPPLDVQYAAWLARNAPGPDEVAEWRAEARALEYRPLMSVLTPVHDVDEPFLRRCLDSVLAQAYDQWELCVVDDGSTRPHVAKVLAEYAARDHRIRAEALAKSQGIVGASAAALRMARGEFVALLDHDDELAPDALLEVAKLLDRERDLDLVYSDEDKLDDGGRRVEPFFKPDWSPDLLLSMNYVCHLTVVRRTVMESVGGFRVGFDGSQDYDLLLRVTERTQRIGHVPKILYHWRKVANSTAADRAAKPYAFETGRKALVEALERRGAAGRVDMPMGGLYTVRYPIRGTPLVSIIIPTRDRLPLLRSCLDSIEAKSTWRHREVLVVDNGSVEPATHAYLRSLEQRVRVVEDRSPFNWSAINNGAVRAATGELLLFLNNDVEVVTPDWLEAMIEHAQRPEVGAVGAKLLYPDDRLQHAGVVLGIGGIAGHAFKYRPSAEDGYFSLPHVIRNCSAVTGACMMVRRKVFDDVGGFDESLPVAFNDIDFCLRLRQRGLLVVYTPQAILYHKESATRGKLHPPEDERRMYDRWGALLKRDPFYNPNLSLHHEDYRLAL